MAGTRNEPLKQVRERELVAATRALFDERGVQDAPIEEIAQLGRHRARARLPPLLLQGGALRAHGHRLPRRARGAARDRDRQRRASRAAALERVAEAYAGLLPALPGLPRQLAGADAPARPPSCRRSSPSRSGCGSARGWRAASGSSPTCCAPGRRAARSRSTTPTTRRTCSGPRRSARCTWRGSASGVRRARPGRPGPVHGQSRPDRPQLRRERPGYGQGDHRLASINRRPGLAFFSALLRTRLKREGKGKGLR